jgi:hypothetical protein
VLITGKYLGEWTCLAIKSPAMRLSSKSPQAGFYLHLTSLTAR